jgi:hypothetical protein
VGIIIPELGIIIKWVGIIIISGGGHGSVSV